MRQISVAERSEFDTQPLYNIKAVVEATGLPAATLRAWERRYAAFAPGRTASGYRLYSARDIAHLRWLKARVDEGMTISQAITWLTQHGPAMPAQMTLPSRREFSGLSGVNDALLVALRTFDESQAERVLGEAFAVYGIETATEHVLAPVMEQIEALWRCEQVTAAVEHFASNFLHRKLDAIINAGPQIEHGPLVVLGCAPNEWHDLGLLLIHLLLRRRGIYTLSLGQNVPVADFADEMARLGPAITVLTATTANTVEGLIALAQAVNVLPAPRPLFGYGGHIFNAQPELRPRVPGIFLGESARGAVGYITALLTQGHAPHPTSAGDDVAMPRV